MAKFPRSESGRTYQLRDADGRLLANAARASRKDARDAVVAARKGFAGLVGRDAVQPRPGDLPDRGDAGRSPGRVRRAVWSAAEPRSTAARAEVDAAVDRLVHYAGWTDKLAAVFGSANPVSGPYFSYSAPEPTGVVGVLAPTTPRCSVWSR